MQKLTSALRKVALWTGALILIVVAALISINAFDEEPAPEVKLLEKVAENSSSAENNLFVALAGFNAPAGVAIIEAGRMKIAEYDAIAKLPLKDQFATRENPAIQRLIFQGALDFCQPLVKSCWKDIQSHDGEIHGLLAENWELYGRYLELHRMTAYYDIAEPPVATFPPSVPGSVRSLFLADVALRIRNAATPQERSMALADLSRDLSTWRTVLTGHATLISKMVAIANLHGELALLGDVIADPTIELAPHYNEIEAMLDQVTLADWKIADVFRSEYRFIAAAYKGFQQNSTTALLIPEEGDEPISWWESYWVRAERYFFKPNATLNLIAQHMLQIQKLANADPQNYLREQQRIHEWREQNLSLGVGTIYNPVGKIMASMASDVWDWYPLRAYDVAAFHRLVRLDYEIRKRDLKQTDLAMFFKQHPEWATHPVSGASFEGDVEKHEIAMHPLGNTPKDRRFRLPLSAKL
jgi:hypothetical protein